jgi:hypothetical protein
MNIKYFIFILLFFSASLAVSGSDTKTAKKREMNKATTNESITEKLESMNGDQLLDSILAIDYENMTEKEYINIYQKLYNKVISVDMKKKYPEGIKFYEALIEFQTCVEQGSGKNNSKKLQKLNVDNMLRQEERRFLITNESFRRDVAEDFKATVEELKGKWNLIKSRQ